MAENLLAQLLSPTLARAAEQQRLQGQVLATADARNPLLAEAGRTANIMRGSLGGLFGTDLRSPIERISEQAKAIQNDPNLNEDQKIEAMKQLDPGLGAAYERDILARKKARRDAEDPGFTIEEIIVGNTTDPITGITRSIKRTVVMDRDKNIVRYLGEGEATDEGVKAEVVNEEVPTQEEGGNREQLAALLREFLQTPEALEAARTGAPIRLPTTGAIVRFDKETNRWVPVQVEQPDVSGELGVNP